MGLLYTITTEKMSPSEYMRKITAIHDAISKGKISPREGFTLTGKLFDAQVKSFKEPHQAAV